MAEDEFTRRKNESFRQWIELMEIKSKAKVNVKWYEKDILSLKHNLFKKRSHQRKFIKQIFKDFPSRARAYQEISR